jgi:hypothetical protein
LPVLKLSLHQAKDVKWCNGNVSNCWSRGCNKISDLQITQKHHQSLVSCSTGSKEIVTFNEVMSQKTEEEK